MTFALELPGRFVSHLRRSGLVRRGEQVLAAVSGGGDSTALAELLARAGEEIGFELAGFTHLHHGLRPVDADLDELFCRELAARLGRPIIVGHADVAERARVSGESVEAEGRQARSELFAESLRTTGAAVVATGHTADDRLETVLLKLARGEGTGGLAGVRPRRADGIVRPLLPFRRRELREWLGSIGVAWREDETNASPTGPLRSRLRAGVIPALSGVFGNDLAERVSASLDRLLEDDEFLEAEARRRTGEALAPDGSLDVRRLLAEPPAMARRVLRRFLEEKGPHRTADSVLTSILQSVQPFGADKSFTIAAGRRIVATGGRIRRAGALPESRSPVSFRYPLSVDAVVRVPEASGSFRIRQVRLSGAPLPSPLSGVRSVVWFPCRPGEAVEGLGLAVRNRLPGDRIHPLGAPGSRKLKEVLIDRHVPRERRDRLPVVVRDDRPVWIPGVVLGEDLRLPNGETNAVELTWEAEP